MTRHSSPSSRAQCSSLRSKSVSISKRRRTKNASIYDHTDLEHLHKYKDPTDYDEPTEGKRPTRSALQRHINLIRAKRLRQDAGLRVRVLVQEEFEDKLVRLNQADYDSDEDEEDEELATDSDEDQLIQAVEEKYWPKRLTTQETLPDDDFDLRDPEEAEDAHEDGENQWPWHDPLIAQDDELGAVPADSDGELTEPQADDFGLVFPADAAGFMDSMCV